MYSDIPNNMYSKCYATICTSNSLEVTLAPPKTCITILCLQLKSIENTDTAHCAHVTYLKSSDSSVVRVQHEHGQSSELSSPVPAVSAVDNDRGLVLLNQLCYPHGSTQHKLEWIDKCRS